MEKEESNEPKVYKMDNLILGTGLIESIVSGSMATYKKLSLNVECENQYSGAMRTLSIREMQKFFTNKEEAELHKLHERKIYGFEHKFLSDTESFDKFIELYGYRNFNIDFLPRLIFSSAKATDYMIQAQIDNYIRFRVIKGIYTITDGKLSSIPTHKGEIFKSKSLGLLEKKQLFNFLSVSMRYFNKQIEEQDDEQNSINDFKKNVYSEHHKVVDSLAEDEALQKEHFVEFMKRTGVSSPKLIKMVAYCLCNFRINPDLYSEYTKDSEEKLKQGINVHTEQFEDQSSKEMLRRLSMFVESLNIQSKLPYLYPIYGCGDITQIFSRISSVYGSVFMLDKDFEVLSYTVYDAEDFVEVEETEENKSEKKESEVEDKVEEKKEIVAEEAKMQTFHKLGFKIRGEENFVVAKNVIIGSEYHKFAKEILNIDWKLDQKQVKQSLTMHRIAILLKIEPVEGTVIEENEYGSKVTDFEKSLPILIQVPDGAADIENKHPITVMITDYTCQSCPQNFCVLYVDYLVENSDTMKEECTKQIDQIYEYVINSLENMLKGDTTPAQLKPLLRINHFQKYENSTLVNLNSFSDKPMTNSDITILPDGDLGLDMERAFQLGHKYVTQKMTLEDDLLFNRETQDFFDQKDDEGGEDEYAEEKGLLDDLEDFDF